MRCIAPLTLKQYDKVERVLKLNTVPCGRCNYCLESKRAQWTLRLSNELKKASTASFLTFTYSDENLPRNEESGLPQLCVDDVQKFLKRLRKANALFTDQKIRYYLVGEYGTETARPHYHAIIFNLDRRVSYGLATVWRKGNIHAGSVTPASIHYTTKYVVNRHGDFGIRTPPFALMSRKPGIGAGYLETHMQWHLADDRYYTLQNGIYGSLPRYYKEKIFSPAHRARMATNAIRMADDAYREEITRLTKFHSDPAAYYDECIVNTHDRVTNKINSQNTF